MAPDISGHLCRRSFTTENELHRLSLGLITVRPMRESHERSPSISPTRIPTVHRTGHGPAVGWSPHTRGWSRARVRDVRGPHTVGLPVAAHGLRSADRHGTGRTGERRPGRPTGCHRVTVQLPVRGEALQVLVVQWGGRGPGPGSPGNTRIEPTTAISNQLSALRSIVMVTWGGGRRPGWGRSARRHGERRERRPEALLCPAPTTGVDETERGWQQCAFQIRRHGAVSERSRGSSRQQRYSCCSPVQAPRRRWYCNGSW